MKAVASLAAVLLTAVYSPTEAQLLAQVRREVTSLQGTAGDLWTNSGSGGYVFRFSQNVVGDESPELFVNMSVRPHVWSVFMGPNLDHYVGELDIRGSGFLVQTDGQSRTLLDAYQSDAQHKFIVEQTITPNGVQRIARRVGKDATEAEYQAVVIHNPSADTTWIAPRMEGILLYDLLTQASPTWFEFDPDNTQIRNGFYRFPRDDIRVKGMESSFTPEVALAKVNQHLGIVQPQAAKPEATITGVTKPGDPGIAAKPSLKAEPTTVSSQRANGDTNPQRSPPLWAVGLIVFLMLLGGLAVVKFGSQPR